MVAAGVLGAALAAQLKYGLYKGRLIQQFAGTVKQADGSTEIQASSVYSDDHGKSWQRGAFMGTAWMKTSGGTLRRARHVWDA